MTPPAERAALIASLPRFVQRASDKQQAAVLLDEVLQPYLDDAVTRNAALVATGRTWLAAGDADRALELARQAHSEDPGATGPVLLALELMPGKPEAERLVTAYLKTPVAEIGAAPRLCRRAAERAALCRGTGATRIDHPPAAGIAPGRG